MIVKMKKVSIVCLLNEKQKTLDSLAEAGVVHLDIRKKTSSEDYAALNSQLADIDKALRILSHLDKKEKVEPLKRKFSGEQICERTLEMAGHWDVLKKKTRELSRRRDLLAPWGDFTAGKIEELREHGVYVYFCSGGKYKVQNPPSGAAIQIIKNENGKYYYLLISDKELDTSKLKIENLLQKKSSYTEAVMELQAYETAEQETVHAMKRIKPLLHQLMDYRHEIKEKIDILTGSNAMFPVGGLAYINGFVPCSQAEQLKKTASDNKWALIIEDPSEKDPVPTLIKMPKGAAMSEPILNFIGVMPGYREWDISLCLLVFFTVFFAMIVNDGGYGIVFLILALLGKIFFKNPKYAASLNLLILLSTAAIGWGWMTGGFFGIPPKHLPSWLRGFDAFSDEDKREHNIQYLCFMIAATHLSVARIWKAVLYLGKKKALGELGWVMILWANFFAAIEMIVSKNSFPPFAYWLYAVGFLLVLIFYVHWNEIGEVFMFPLHLMNSFVDILSYIRLFALGISGYYIAESFNKMGLLLFNSLSGALSWIAIAGMIIIFFLGHLLNIGLALIGVLVHDVRLNALEFSNQMGLQWAGIKYRPLTKTKKISNEEEKK